MRGSDYSRRLLVDLLAGVLAGGPRDVIDLGGGTGGLAATLAGSGHRVTVVEPSPDALAAVERRAAEAGVADRLTARQGDSSTLGEDIGAESADLVLCHDVLPLVDNRAAALSGIAKVLRPGGGLSLTVEQRYPRAIKLAASGDFVGAHAVWTDSALLGPGGTREQLAAAGFTVQEAHGLGIVTSRIPDDVSLGRAEELVELERLFGADPSLHAAAPWLHLYATLRPADSEGSR